MRGRVQELIVESARHLASLCKLSDDPGNEVRDAVRELLLQIGPFHTLGKNVESGQEFPSLDVRWKSVDGDVCSGDRNESKHAVPDGYSERPASLLELAPVGIFEVHRDGAILYANKKFQEIFRVTVTEGGTLYFSPLVDTEQKRELQQRFTAAFCHRQGMVYECPAALPHQRDPRWIRITLAPPTPVNTIVGTVEDISEKKYQERLLQESEATFVSICKTAHDGIFMVNREGNVSFWNGAAERIFGYTEHEALGKDFEKLLIPERFRKGTPTALENLDTEDPLPHPNGIIEAVMRKKNGDELPIEISSSAIKIDGRWNMVGFVRDISDRKRAEVALQLAKEASEAASSAKSEFLANMSHEIRTPLNAIIGLSQITLESELTAQQKSHLGGVHQSATHLLKLINDILDFSRIEAGCVALEEKRFHPRSTVASAVETLAVRANEKGLTMTCHVRQDVPSVLLGDPVRVRQILLNLGDNALKFTEAGTVTITCGLERKDEDWATLRFTVTDTGVGIPPEKLDIIFDKFQQADSSATRKYGGTGLGLSISKILVEKMGGTLWVESTIGQGSTFSFSIICRLSEKINNDVDSTKERGQNRIIVVDADITERTRLVEALSLWGCSHTEVADAEAAWNEMIAANKRKMPYNLAIIDVQVPPTNGFDLIRRIFEEPECAQTKVLMLTPMGLIEDEEATKARGIDSVLICPVQQDELHGTLQELLVHDSETGTTGRERACIDYALSRRRTNKGTTILVAEDNYYNRMMMVSLLEKFCYSVVVAENGRQAVELVEKHDVNVVLMDVQMPVMDGFEATRNIRRKETGTGNHLPIIALTAHAFASDRELCYEAGMDDFLSKPVAMDKILNVLEGWGNRPTLKEYVGQSKSTGPKKSGLHNVGILPVTIKKALEQASGDSPFLQRMLQHFVEHQGGWLETLQALIEQGQAEQIGKEAHALKGAARTLGADRIAAVALRLEEIGKMDALENAEEVLEELREEWQRLDEFIRMPNWMEVG